MVIRLLFAIGLLALSLPALAEPTLPVFGSSTQGPVSIAINPDTGQPVATADTSIPVVASAQ